MPRAARGSRRKPATVTPRVKVWLEINGSYAFGLGVAEILQAVDRTGSLKEAAASIGKSYRHVWGRVKQAEQALGRSLVETRVGGHGPHRSSLTAEARQLTSAFLALRRRMAECVGEEFRRHFV